ncbi:hypothetical protein KAFR_0I02955 [Kazachstania africana CBS 2517]|uniref:Uncharacterized protein n=1 Tax=Kazachstania africana (strain ATCC 22294 / BCRC 22015 / CBS 2517 / CECT 1963 / NBRC 1671 / NRRL Y-8276) TaxID=1071382 RepID=H2B0C5_KAZAF|nr:hypothetical protein KAFR_0I02955 [Kazachstania africana CBS 2517]CCF60075.1 hypothetical protein KAFR_0I02955 [Kazachstania africana CBS 2517]
MRFFSLFCFASFIVVALATVPDYDYIHLIVTTAYAYFPDDKLVVIKAAWWASFVASSSTTIEAAIDTRSICKNNHEDSASLDCASSVSNLATSLVLNLISIYIHWYFEGIPNGTLKGVKSTAVRRRQFKHWKALMVCMTYLMLLIYYLITILNQSPENSTKLTTH